MINQSHFIHVELLQSVWTQLTLFKTSRSDQVFVYNRNVYVVSRNYVTTYSVAFVRTCWLQVTWSRCKNILKSWIVHLVLSLSSDSNSLSDDCFLFLKFLFFDFLNSAILNENNELFYQHRLWEGLGRLFEERLSITIYIRHKN